MIRQRAVTSANTRFTYVCVRVCVDCRRGKGRVENRLPKKGGT